ncbi:MAG: glycerophosphodiester phosphodiesterase [Opitutaceae bacterium]|nr:glycerophosphodiester phosphodiesterase [Opitutaceae bacterium]
MASPLVIAHRGASAEAPENTLAAFRRALALRVDAIELDVQLSRDGVPVVFHDAALRRLTGEPGRLADRTWRQLRRLRVAGREPIPALAEVLRLTRGRAVVQIELKRGAAVAPVLRAVRRARAEDGVILASFEAGLVRDAARLAPGIPRMLISNGRLPAPVLLRRLLRCGAHGLSVHWRAVRSVKYPRYFHARGLSVWSWTVNTRALARRLRARGIDGLLGDNPVLLKPSG